MDYNDDLDFLLDCDLLDEASGARIQTGPNGSSSTSQSTSSNSASASSHGPHASQSKSTPSSSSQSNQIKTQSSITSNDASSVSGSVSGASTYDRKPPLSSSSSVSGDKKGMGSDAASVTSSTASQSKKSNGGKREELSPSAWLMRRRAQIATASKKGREKKKMEENQLRDENERLRKERAEYLQTIEKLVQEVEKQRESKGIADEQIENEMLTMQLREYKEFLNACIRLSHGLSLGEIAKYEMVRQAGDYVVNNLLRRVSQSQNEIWAVAQLSERPDRYPIYRYHFCASYKREMSTKKENPVQRIIFRIDVVFPGITADQVVKMYQKPWKDSETFSQILGSKVPIELVPIHITKPSKADWELYRSSGGSKDHSEGQPMATDSSNELMASNEDSSLFDDEDVFASFYREYQPPPEKPREWAHCSIHRIQYLARSTLQYPPEMLPALALTLQEKLMLKKKGIGVSLNPDDFEDLVASRSKRKKNGSAVESILGAYGGSAEAAAAAFASASSSTAVSAVSEIVPVIGKRKCHVAGRAVSSSIPAPNDPRFQRMDSFFSDGMIVWDEDIETAFEAEPNFGARAVIIVESTSETQPDHIGTISDLIDESNVITEHLSTILERYHAFLYQNE